MGDGVAIGFPVLGFCGPEHAGLGGAVRYGARQMVVVGVGHGGGGGSGEGGRGEGGGGYSERSTVEVTGSVAAVPVVLLLSSIRIETELPSANATLPSTQRDVREHPEV